VIRPAHPGDLRQIIDLGRLMHEESPRLGKLRYVPAKAYTAIGRLIDSEDGFVRVVEEDGEIIGGIACCIKDHWYSTDKMAYDIALFVRPDRRGGLTAAKLVKEYVEWAREKGAVITQFGISTGVHLASTGALLNRLGFEASGFLYDYSGTEK
jgi:GNAT superfamily N-acetyltransferase